MALNVTQRQLGRTNLGATPNASTTPRSSPRSIPHVFLEPHAASYLDDKLLDAYIDGQQVRFAVSHQR